jgi:transposase-like protein
MNKQPDRQPRRHFSGAEKVAILKRHLLDKVPISDLCDELHLYPNQVHAWLKEFFENGHAAFDNGRKAKAVEDAKDKRIEQLEAKLARKNEVMAELMEAHTQLKKELGEI